jgi:DNA-binding NtrC family response regulator
MVSVLVVDDDAGIRESAVMALERAGHRTLQAGDVAAAMSILRKSRVDVVVSDIYMPGDNGLALLEAISERRDPPRVILMTARGSIETTALAHRSGAFDYLAKPFELGELVARVAAAVATQPGAAAIEPGPPSRIVGSDRSMIAMYKAIARIAALDVPVLILGESGSGKELVAESVHDLSHRSKGPLITVNCGAIPDTLLENELFGSVRGAYTDSRQDRRGALSRADRGTLFLDEVGDISASFQVKLLRFLQDGMITPLGGDKSHHLSVRVLAATHRDLRQMIADGRFREDLYYRLAGYEIAVPPLRERTSDIPILVDHLRKKIGAEMHLDVVPGPSQSVVDLLSRYRWPGNVRELEQVIRRTIIDSGGLTDANAAERALQSMSLGAGRPAPAPETAEPHRDQAEPEGDLFPLDEAERRHIENVLRATAGNQTQAAFILGIERKTLARKMKRMGISIEKS